MLYQFRALDTVVGSCTVGRFFEWETISFEKYQEICKYIEDGYSYEARKLAPTLYYSDTYTRNIELQCNSVGSLKSEHDSIPLCLYNSNQVIALGYVDKNNLFTGDTVSNVYSRAYLRLIEDYDIVPEILSENGVIVGLLITESSFRIKK